MSDEAKAVVKKPVTATVAKPAVATVAKKPVTVAKPAVTAKAPVKPVTTAKPAVTAKPIDKAKVAKVKGEITAKRESKAVVAPTVLPKSVNKVANPIVENGRLKRAMAVALAMVEQDKDKLAILVVKSGIPFKQVIDKASAEKPDLLSKTEWSGKTYASWALFNAKSYAEANKEKVDQCMPFAKSLVAGK